MSDDTQILAELEVALDRRDVALEAEERRVRPDWAQEWFPMPLVVTAPTITAQRDQERRHAAKLRNHDQRNGKGLYQNAFKTRYPRSY